MDRWSNPYLTPENINQPEQLSSASHGQSWSLLLPRIAHFENCDWIIECSIDPRSSVGLLYAFSLFLDLVVCWYSGLFFDLSLPVSQERRLVPSWWRRNLWCLRGSEFASVAYVCWCHCHNTSSTEAQWRGTSTSCCWPHALPRHFLWAAFLQLEQLHLRQSQPLEPRDLALSAHSIDWEKCPRSDAWFHTCHLCIYLALPPPSLSTSTSDVRFWRRREVPASSARGLYFLYYPPDLVVLD